MKKSQPYWIQLAVISCFVACIGDFVVSFLLSMLYSGYNSLQQSESILGTSNSPVAGWVALWSIVFTGLLIFYALGLRRTFVKEHKGITLLAGLIIIYAIGEGLMSGLFPYDFVNGKLTFPGKIHAVSGIIGQAGLYFVPLVAWYALAEQYPKLKPLSLLVIFAGSVFLLLYGATKLNLIDFRGLWQRLFMGVYFLYLMYLAILTSRQAKKSRII